MSSESAQDLCLAYLREEILSGRLAPGNRIRPDAVALRLGVSRMPVRQALQVLGGEGLVTLRPNRAPVVTELRHADLVEIFEMRALLEGLCARHAADLVTAADIEDLDMEAQAMRRIANNAPRWVERHERFHDHICLLGDRPRAAGEARRLRLLLRPVLRRYVATEWDPETLGHEHELIVDALRDRDADRAEKLVVAHVNANAAAMLGIALADLR